MDKQVIIIGAGGHGKVIADIIEKSRDRVVGFLDDDPNLSGRYCRLPVLGTVEKYEKYKECWFIAAIGDASARRRIADRLQGVKWYTAVHPLSVISSMGVSIGEGTAVMANAVVNPDAVIGRHCIINTGALVEHDDRVEDFVHISVGAKLGGGVRIGANTWIGIGAVVSNNQSVCAGCVVGAGAVVINNIEEAGTYVGVPAGRVMN